MNNKNQNGNRISLVGAALILLGYMLLQIVKAYLAGGADAPSTAILILAIVVLGGGIVFTVFYLCLLMKKASKPSDQNGEDSPEEETKQ